MRWEKLGRVFMPEGQQPWIVSHGQDPVAERLGGDRYRVFFSSRDGSNRSHIGWLEFDIGRPQEVVRLAETPLIAPGPIGAFDDRGAMCSWVLCHAGRRYHYYIGWNVRDTVPSHPSIGLAHGPVGQIEIAERLEGPVLERGPGDPLFCSNPCVLVDDGRWRMWYISGVAWLETGGDVPGQSYNIRYAESDDGVVWRPQDGVAIDFEHDEEIAIARPCVVKESDRYRMWYCYRGRSYGYRIGYAESEDGRRWVRRDNDVGLTLSEAGWDSEMLAYPYVFDHEGQRFMLYCGNDYGRNGFGLAACT